MNVKNMNTMSFEVDQNIYLEYSTILEQDDTTLFINYSHIDDFPLGTLI